MISVIVRHEIADFDEWRRAFLGFADLNARHGARNPEIYRAVDDPNDAIVKPEFESIEAATTLLKF